MSVKEIEARRSDLAVWSEMGAGVGLRCDGAFIAIDIDSLSSKWALQVHEAALSLLGEAPVRIGRSPKELLLYRTDDDIPYMQCRFDDGVDKKKPGVVEALTGASGTKWFVMHGVHPVTEKPYRWPNGYPRAEDLTTVTNGQVTAFFDHLAERLPACRGSRGLTTDRAFVDQASLRGNPNLIAAAMRATPNDARVIGYTDWSTTAAALRGALPDDEALGRELFCEWSEKAELDAESERPDRVYDSFKAPFGLGADFIYSQAERLGGWTGRRDAQVSGWFEPIGPKQEQEQEQEQTGEDSASPSGTTKLFTFTSLGEAAAGALVSSARPLIKDVLDQGAMSVLYGESNVGKTFVAMDIAYHVTRGLQWAGKRTAALPALYIAAEGGGGARKRAAALVARHGDAPDFRMLMHPVNLLRADADLGPLLASIKASGIRFGLIVVDTLSRAMGGGDENASTDMGTMVRHLDAVRAQTSAHLMVIHHSGKDRAKGARGHSLLRAATDTEIEVADGVIKVTKQRDLDKSFEQAFDLDVVTLGIDQDGDPVTSCVLRLRDAAAEAKEAEARDDPAEADKKRQIATFILTATDGAPRVNLAGVLDTVGELMRRAGLTRAKTARQLTGEISVPLLEGVVVEHKGQIVRVKAWKERPGQGNAPWLISSEVASEASEVASEDAGQFVRKSAENGVGSGRKSVGSSDEKSVVPQGFDIFS